jgi:NADH:ubiquinone oxidoreductase subunit 5 (subunit L)/multisubunit Na+/H+ antiporter MnhA subunit
MEFKFSQEGTARMQDQDMNKVRKLRAISKASMICTLICVLTMLGRYMYTYFFVDPAKITECFQSQPTGTLLYIAIAALIIGIITMNRADKIEYNL